MDTTTTTNTNFAPRRGSVLIFALAILAVLALLGATYVTRANLDRVSAEAAVRRSALADQPEIVIEHSRALLTADLFGNKIVSKSTPRTIDPPRVEAATGGAAFTDDGEAIDIWPVMFEDGEHWDYPSVDEIDYIRSNAGVDSYSFARATGNNDNYLDDGVRNQARLRFDTTLGMFETARPDDAWLAATEPVDHTGNEPIGSYNGLWDTWSQITNPRSAYRWVADPDHDADNNDRGAWVRDDGRYADLARFFNTPNAVDRERGDPAADLLDRDQDHLPNPFYDPDDSSSVLNLSPDYNSAVLGVEQRRIYGLQMNQLAEWYELSSFDPDTDDAPFEPVDERFWADTDGDGRPDARWSVLDELDGQGDMRWVIAMRIADNSAAVNVNTALEALPTVQSGFDWHQLYGDGATPMDVDLVKLFMETATTPQDSSARAGASDLLRHPDIRGLMESDIRTGLRRHFRSGLGFDGDLVEAPTGSMSSYFSDPDYQGLRDFIGWEPGEDDNFAYTNDNVDFPTTRAQREAYWRLFASRPDSPYVRGGRRYDLKEEVELRGSFGANFPGVKSIESNFDGAYIANDSRLPGALANPYPDQNSLGPMRSAEFGNVVSRDDLMNVDLPEFSAGNYSQQQRIERIQKDIRRSLTVASGASARSVVPAIGEREVVPGRLKPLVNAGAWNGLDAGLYNLFSSSLDIEDAFEAFTWALAPLATNRPVMSALTGRNLGGNDWISRYDNFYSVNPDFHYGGGTNGPARAWAADPDIDVLMPLTAEQMGPTYALFRAASLAVNLRDAVDGEGTLPRPTVARLITAPDIPETQLPNDSDADIILTTRFAHGDIDDADPDQASIPGSVVIPNAFVQPTNGVTFVGLDRQPFISEAFALCMYQYGPVTLTGGSMPPATVDITGAGETIAHAMVAVELINPWDADIDLDGYTLMLTDGTNTFTADIGGIAPRGERFVVILHDTDDDPEARRSVDSLMTSLSVASEEFAVAEDDQDAFSGWDRVNTSILLYRTRGASQYLVDRMRNPGMTSFPYNNDDLNLASAVVDATDDMADTYGAWYSVGSNLARSSLTPMPGGTPAGGFPVTVLERPDFNEVHFATTDADNGAEGWHDAEPARSHFEIFQGDAIMDRASALTLGIDNVTSAMIGSIRPFTLFVPDGPLIAQAELGMISAFAHTYIHGSNAAPLVGIGDADPKLSRWSTVSEQLAKDYHLNYNATATGVPMNDDASNPYLGVLDPARYILGERGDLGSGTNMHLPNLPSALAVPLALRVYDAFEVLGDNLSRTNALVEGRININTAPKRVLATLPMVLPVDYHDGVVPNDLNMQMGQQPKTTAYARLNGMIQYREGLRQSGPTGRWNDDPLNVLLWSQWQLDTRDGMLGSGFGGIREDHDEDGDAIDAMTVGPNDHRKGLGYVSLGELSILANWTNGVFGSTTNAPVPNDSDFEQHGFLELATDIRDNTMHMNERNVLDVRRRDVTIAGLDVLPADPIDDVEERLAIFRAVSNIATTRSDVYHVWYIARAYSPAAIEGVEVPPTLSTVDERAELLNDLPVAFEERGFLVLDRSNVMEPTDRPRVLLRVVLDSTTAAN